MCVAFVGWAWPTTFQWWAMPTLHCSFIPRRERRVLLRRVDAMRSPCDLHYIDRSPVLQRPELLEFFGLFQCPGRPLAEVFKEIPVIRVDAQMQIIRRVVAGVCVAAKGNRRTRKIERPPIFTHHDLHQI